MKAYLKEQSLSSFHLQSYKCAFGVLIDHIIFSTSLFSLSVTTILSVVYLLCTQQIWILVIVRSRAQVILTMLIAKEQRGKLLLHLLSYCTFGLNWTLLGPLLKARS